ncbi:GtrA family protein [Thiorhodovibrio winogradskyi]|nr:GtrA family protein [Thiorhodovibrio winogradskyi]
MSNTQGQLLRELATAVRFGLVGLVATATHLVSVYLLVSSLQLPPQLANLLAFVLAFGVSLVGHQHWTFAARADPRQARRRFFLVAVAAYAANSLLLGVLLRMADVAPALSAVLAASCVPLFSYLASRLWAFVPAR